MTARPVIGIGILVKKDDKYLLGKRVSEHGKNTWSVVGGHLEFGESFEDCAYRETLEESGVKIKNIKFLTVLNNIFKDENHHSITIFMTAEWKDGKPTITEPYKIIDLGWYDLSNHPEPLFFPVQQLKLSKPELFK